MSNLRVVVIGAGTAGICAAKIAREYGLEVVAYEQSDQIGGNWNYTGRVGPDKFGLNYGFMYEGLITNVPKEIMSFMDLAFPERDHSYLTQAEVLEYLNYYVAHFDVAKDIKLRHEVIRVNPTKDGRWEVIVRDLLKDEFKIELFDFVMVCSGHHWDPRYPNFKGEDLYTGKLSHACDFRQKEKFAGKNYFLFLNHDYNPSFTGQKVCIIGSGSSSLDIAFMLSAVCPEVIYCQHYPYTEDAKFPENLKIVADVQELNETGVILKDGTTHSVDAIIYSTGFYYSYPFLSTECGVFVEDNYVQPLYKQIINIKYPTMGFIGLHYHLCVQLVIDLQSRFCLKYWTTNRPWPSKTEMLEVERQEMEIRLAKGWKKRHAHRLWDLHEKYNSDLAELADIPGIDPVYLGIYFDAMGCLRMDYQNYRNDSYRIIDKEKYEKIVDGGKDARMNGVDKS